MFSDIVEQPGVLQFNAEDVVAHPLTMFLPGCLRSITSFAEQPIQIHSLGPTHSACHILVYRSTILEYLINQILPGSTHSVEKVR